MVVLVVGDGGGDGGSDLEVAAVPSFSARGCRNGLYSSARLAARKT